MKLRVLGFSSSGNCYLLQSSSTGEVLCIEAGIKLAKLKRALGFDVSSIAGCIVSHEHGDHAGHVQEFLDARIPTYMSEGTLHIMITRSQIKEHTFAPYIITGKRAAKIGSFTVMPFDVQHDAAEPFGFLISHPECGTVLFATDTYYLKYKFNNLSNIMLECNYRQDILDRNIAAGLVSPTVRDRIIKSHMSYNTCLETLLANDLGKVNNIVLLHLSSDNSHAAEFVDGIQSATDKNVVAAAKGLVIDFNKTPY